MLSNQKLAVLTVSLLSAHALACMPPMPQRVFQYDENSNQVYVTDGFSKHEVDLAKGYREVLEKSSFQFDQNAIRGLKFASDGKHAYVISQLGNEQPIVGAKDYKTLVPLANATSIETDRFGWRYYVDKFSVYAVSYDKTQIVLKPLAKSTDSYRLEQGLLVVNDKVFWEAQELPIKGSEFKVTKYSDELYLISDGHATYASEPLFHQDMDEPRTWYGNQYWIKLVDQPKIKVIGGVDSRHRLCFSMIYSYDVIFEADGKLFFNKKALIASSASTDEKLKAVTQQLLKLGLYLVRLTERSGIMFNPSSSIYEGESTLFFEGKEYPLGNSPLVNAEK